jgi:hypothetical protein
MKVEAYMAANDVTGHGWRDLFGPSLIRRTMIGVGVMFFQRTSFVQPFRVNNNPNFRMERHQCTVILWTTAHEEYWARGRRCIARYVWVHQYNAVDCCGSCILPAG